MASRLTSVGESEIRLTGNVQITSIKTEDGKEFPLEQPIIVPV